MKKYFVLTLLLMLAVSGCSGSEIKANARDAGLIVYSKTVEEFKIKDDNAQNVEPAILYAYSNFLYSKSAKDEAVFWFYLAQFRNRYLEEVSKEDLPINAQLFIKFFRESGFVGNVSVVDNGSIVYSPASDPEYSKMNSMYSAANRDNIYKAGGGLGEVINPYAFANVDKHIARLKDLIVYEKAHPIMAENLVEASNLVSADEREKIKQGEFVKLEKFIKYLEENKDEIRKTRAKNNLPNE